MARTFTFGMLYAFTRSLRLDSSIGRELPWLAGMQHLIVSYGQYAVLAVLVVEISLFVAHTLCPVSGRVAPAQRTTRTTTKST